MILFLIFHIFICVVCAEVHMSDSKIQNSNSGFNYNLIAETSFSHRSGKTYRPEWKDLDSRPLPDWYDRAKIGIFIHWGVYSVPSFGSEWFWMHWVNGSKAIKEFMSKNYRPGFTYQDFGPMFTAEFFNSTNWASIFANSGARYVVLTTKHHEGYTLFPSKRSFSWNSVEVGPGINIVKQLSQAVRAKGLKFGIYHSLYEWFNPMYLDDKGTNFTTRVYPDVKVWPEIQELINDYKPSVLWADGDWEADENYWRSKELLAWLYSESPVKNEIVVNDRWGIGTYCKHGDFYNCQDRYNPGILQNHKWENAFTLDKRSWGYRRNLQIEDVYSFDELVKEVVSTVSCGGNVLINVGPTKEGTIPTIFQERLSQLGKWLKINGEAIYDTSPWTHQNDSLNSNVWYTCTKKQYNPGTVSSKPKDAETVVNVFIIFLEWPQDGILRVQDVVLMFRKGVYKVQLVGTETASVTWTIKNGVAEIELPKYETVHSKHAWVLKVSKN